MDKKTAVSILVDCAKKYDENYANKNNLIIYKKHDDILYIETLFLPRHFLHLAGVSSCLRASYFYNKCLYHKLLFNDFDLKKDGTSALKLSILCQMMKISNFSRMIGGYNRSQINLCTDKIVGNLSISLGFVKENKYYVPNTLLREDIRKLVDTPHKIMAVFTKNVSDDLYSQEEYKCNDLDFSAICSLSCIKQR